MDGRTPEDLAGEIKELRARLDEADGTLRAIRSGEIDAIIVSAPKGEQIFTLRGADHVYRMMVEQMSESAVTLNAEGVVLFGNSNLSVLLDFPAERMLGKSFQDFVSPCNRALFGHLLRQAIQDKAKGEVLLKTTIGAEVPVYLSLSALHLDEKTVVTVLITDLSEQKRTEQMLSSGRLSDAILEQAAEAIVVCDPGGVVIRASSYARQLCWKDPLGCTFEDAFPLEAAESSPREAGKHPAMGSGIQARYVPASPANRGYVQGAKARLRCGNGQDAHMVFSSCPIQGENEVPLGWVATLTNITDLKVAEQRLAHQAFHDCLTGLPNRALFLDRLDQALKTARRNPASLRAVLFLDLDRFKIINDSLGHAVGDEVLKTVGQALRECVREHDTVSRLGGDEFAIILEDLSSQSEIIRIVKRINSRLSKRVSIAGLDLSVMVSIGIVISFEGQTPDDILRNADIAMYHAKKNGPGKFKVFTPRMRDQVVKTMHMEHDLRRAIEKEELEVHFQPIVELATGRLHGLEVLARWRHPEHGLIPPLEFIPLAEETGLILPLGRLVLSLACKHVSQWNDALPAGSALSVHVNLSPRQFRDSGLIHEVEHVLAEHKMPAHLLNLEITETAIMENALNAEGILKRYKDLGVGLSLDDFGTGYSSLGNLYRFPVDTLKIDRSFVGGLAHNLKTTAMVNTIIALARNLEMSVVAEGVESEEQAERLNALGCGYVQGHHYSRPLSVHDMNEFIRATTPWSSSAAA